MVMQVTDPRVSLPSKRKSSTIPFKAGKFTLAASFSTGILTLTVKSFWAENATCYKAHPPFCIGSELSMQARPVEDCGGMNHETLSPVHEGRTWDPEKESVKSRL
jgi:hypothetical protein